MKKQYMQPEWRITFLEENFITTSPNVTFWFNKDDDSFDDNALTEGWKW